MNGPTDYQINSLKHLCTGNFDARLSTIMLGYKFGCDDALSMMPTSDAAADLVAFAELAFETSLTKEGVNAMIADARELVAADSERNSIGYHVGLGLGD